MKQNLTWIWNNRKSNATGLVGITLTTLLVMHKITIEEFLAIGGFLSSIGFIIHDETK
jgi:hypothetical protein